MAQIISSRSYDSNHNHISWAIMSTNEYSYLHVVKPHLHFPDKERIPAKHYPFAKTKLDWLKSENHLIKEGQESFYLYLITDKINNISYPGIIGLASVKEFLEGKIKKHENTLTKKEEALVEHMDYVKAVGEPVLLFFNEDNWFDELLASLVGVNPEYDFSGDDGLHHQLWVIKSQDSIKKIQEGALSTSAFYIADGHHRSAGAARYFDNQSKKAALNENDPAAWFMAYFIPASRIRLYEFNRVVKDLNGLSEESFIKELENKFKVEKIGAAKLSVKKKSYRFGMYMNKVWYGLDFKNSPENLSVLDGLDVSLIENEILKPILGIKDSKTDERLSFIDGRKGIARLQEVVDNGEYKVAFSLYPTKIEEVIAVSDEGKTMPPKSTWFEPKLRTGLIIHEL